MRADASLVKITGLSLAPRILSSCVPHLRHHGMLCVHREGLTLNLIHGKAVLILGSSTPNPECLLGLRNVFFFQQLAQSI